jgi:cation transport regulator ChaC
LDEAGNPDADQAPSEGLIYLASEDNPAFLGDAPLADIAQQIAQAHGPSGPNSAYLLNLAQALRELGTEDAHIFALEAQLQRYQ